MKHKKKKSTVKLLSLAFAAFIGLGILLIAAFKIEAKSYAMLAAVCLPAHIAISVVRDINN